RVIAGESSSSIEKHLVSVEVGTSLFQFIKGSWASKRSGEIAQDSNYTKVL
ncbi:hypothetical protein S83_034998, partial [Arachis hypogaea]